MGLFPETMDFSGILKNSPTSSSKKSGFAGALAGIASGAASGGSMDVGSLANGALAAAASAIPFGDVALDILNSLGLQENIGLVSSYGISSWGASTSPEQTKAEFAKVVYPFMEEKLLGLNPSNLAETINSIEDLLLSNHYYYVALRDNHSKAKSTRLANDWAQKEMINLSNNFVATVKSKFAPYNVKFTRVKSNETAKQLAERGAIYHLKNGKSFLGGPSRDLNNYLAKQYYNWTVDFSNVKGLKVDEEGNVSENTGSSLGVIAALAFGAFKLFK